MKLILSILGLFFLSCMIFFSFSASEARSIHRKTTAKSTTTSTTTTTTTNLCANVTCLNEGVCVVLGNMSVCACRDGFVGENCETYYLSLLTTKANQEQTEEVVDEEEQEEEEVEFVEEEDEESLKFDPSPCSGISCPNGDECFVFQGKGFCPIESIIPQLNASSEIVENWECDNNPCENNQPCMKVSGKDTCFCTNIFEPPFCSLPATQPPKSTKQPPRGKPIAKECDVKNNPCLNEQRCLEINNEPTCFCTGQFKVPYCS